MFGWKSISITTNSKDSTNVTAVITAMKDEIGRGPRSYENDLLLTVPVSWIISGFSEPRGTRWPDKLRSIALG